MRSKSLKCESGAEVGDDGADGGQLVCGGAGNDGLKLGFEGVEEFDEVEGVGTEVVDEDVVETHLRDGDVEVPRDDGLYPTLNRTFHLPSIVTRQC